MQPTINQVPIPVGVPCRWEVMAWLTPAEDLILNLLDGSDEPSEDYELLEDKELLRKALAIASTTHELEKFERLESLEAASEQPECAWPVRIKGDVDMQFSRTGAYGSVAWTLGYQTVEAMHLGIDCLHGCRFETVSRVRGKKTVHKTTRSKQQPANRSESALLLQNSKHKPSPASSSPEP